jgi:hypothetical protein
MGFKLTILVAIGNDSIGSCKSNYHTIMSMTAPSLIRGVPFGERRGTTAPVL